MKAFEGQLKHGAPKDVHWPRHCQADPGIRSSYTSLSSTEFPATVGNHFPKLTLHHSDPTFLVNALVPETMFSEEIYL